MGAANLNKAIICLIILAASTFVGRGIMRRGDLLLGMAESAAEKSEGQAKALQLVIKSSEGALEMGRAVHESSERIHGRIAMLQVLSAAVAKSLAAFAETTALISESNREVTAAADVVRERISDQARL